ncbi:unnamed protein product [Hydatigera taeniaeformis]|uniref:BRCT domain-containing protein n=1 Tax=Hydatigena taeniaeformis TaxID=6205 RepID=A0A0R3WMQ2_HYDTA|nr:unnamed protein product [Hydatigera taeniaeformis]
MPEVKPEGILSFSSEDKAYPASNLLKVSAFSKWKCQQAGTKHASVTFKFACPVQFSRLDIGNEASAFISVEVSRADSSEFELLLPFSSFMSPADAKKGVSLNRVRIFSGSELAPSISSQKWDIVRINCTQPFNCEFQYGLSFVRFYRTPDVDEVTSTAVLEEGRNSSKESDALLKPGGLFRLAKRGDISEGKLTVTRAESVKTATASTAMDSQGETGIVTTTASVASTSSTAALKVSSFAEESGEAGSREKSRRILEGVVVAFSGYKNPYRSALREMCLRLGAKYRQDWTDDCTHLIWIQACDAAQQRVSWRPYRVGRAPSPPGHISDDNDDVDSDWDILAFVNAGSMVEDANTDEWRPDSSDQDDEESNESSVSCVSEDSQPEDEESEVEDGSDSGTKNRPSRQKKRRVKDLAPFTSRSPRRNVGGEDTDEEIQRNLGNNPASTQNPESLPPLPDYFSGRKFYIFSKDFDVKEEEIVLRRIIAFGGSARSYRYFLLSLFLNFLWREVEHHMSPAVEFVVSRAGWCKEFDEAQVYVANIVDPALI